MIHEDCIKMIRSFGNNDSIRQAFVDLFNAVASDAESQGLPSGTLVVPFYDDNCSLVPGDWAAELHLVARKVAEDDSDSEADSDPTEEIG